MTDRPHSAADQGKGAAVLDFRMPRPSDGPAISALIARCPPLDVNSAYCNLLQCTHFAQTSVVAELQGSLAGWISGYRLPADPRRFFVWQVAVHPDARGHGVARKMLESLLGRSSLADTEYLLTTITEENAASWALFESYARSRAAPLSRSVLFDKDLHFAGNQATEWQVEIGPFHASKANGG